MDNFEELYQRYLDNKATEDERNKLFVLVKTGKYNYKIDRQIMESLVLEAEAVPTTDETDRLTRLREQRLRMPVRQPAPAHRAPSNRRRWIAAIAALVVMVPALYLFIAQQKDFNSTPQTARYTTQHFTGKQFITLPDNSTVLLNDHSTLTYQESFGKNTREVTLTGEGYFDIQHDSDRPFMVHTGAIKTTVLGTAFNIKAPEDTQSVIVTVVRGKVAVGDDHRVYDHLLADEQLAINPHSREFEKTQLHAENTLAWQQNFLILNRVSMLEAATIIGNHYNRHVTIVNPALKDCIIKATFLQNESLEHVISMISRTMNATYVIDEHEVIIQGGVACQ